MSDLKIICIICVIFFVILLMIYIHFYIKTQIFNNIINGYWEISKDFENKSKLKTCSAWINTKDSTIFIFMENDNLTLINKIVDFNFYNNLFNLSNSELKCEIEFDENIEPLKKRCDLIINLNDGKLTLKNDDEILLILYKNNKSTSGIV